MKKFSYYAALLLAAGVFTLSSCKKDEDEAVTPTEEKSLYKRLGGVEAITLVVDQFITNVVADAEINDKFAVVITSTTQDSDGNGSADGYDSPRFRLLRANLIDQICAGSGGPCVYKGKSMVDAHAGMGITDVEFNALVGDLVAALDTYNVPEKEKNDLLAILGPMQSDIVE